MMSIVMVVGREVGIWGKKSEIHCSRGLDTLSSAYGHLKEAPFMSWVFVQVLTWAKQHEQRLATALTELLNNATLLEDLLSWLQWAETTILQRDSEALPQDITLLKTLITEHQVGGAPPGTRQSAGLLRAHASRLSHVTRVSVWPRGSCSWRR